MALEGLGKYEIKASAAEKYYDIFLQNSLKNRSYKIKLKDNSEHIGVPTASTFFNPFDPDASFNFKTEDGKFYRIPFSILIDAEIML